MKRTISLVLGCAVLALPATAFEKRTFKSADGSKTFEAVLTGYDAKSDLVKVRKGARTMSFKLSALSAEDQEYIQENANALAAASAIKVQLDPYKERGETKKTGSVSTTVTKTGYDIEIRNWTGNDIADVEVQYTIFHLKAAEKGPGTVAQTTGSFDISTLFKQSDHTEKTVAVDLVRYVREKSGGG